MTLNVNQLGGFGGGGRPSLALSYINTYTYNGAGYTNRTFTSCSIGTADAKRYVLVGVMNNDSTDLISTVTVGGAATTRIATITSGGMAFFLTNAPVTSGTTADIAVTNSGTVSANVVNVYTIVGDVNPTPVASVIVERSSGTVIGAQSIASYAGGAVIALARTGTSASSWSWTGLTENYDADPTGSGSTYTAASLAPTSNNLSLSVTPTAGSSSYACFLMVSLRAVGA